MNCWARIIVHKWDMIYKKLLRICYVWYPSLDKMQLFFGVFLEIGTQTNTYSYLFMFFSFLCIVRTRVESFVLHILDRRWRFLVGLMTWEICEDLVFSRLEIDMGLLRYRLVQKRLLRFVMKIVSRLQEKLLQDLEVKKIARWTRVR